MGCSHEFLPLTQLSSSSFPSYLQIPGNKEVKACQGMRKNQESHILNVPQESSDHSLELSRRSFASHDKDGRVPQTYAAVLWVTLTLAAILSLWGSLEHKSSPRRPFCAPLPYTTGDFCVVPSLEFFKNKNPSSTDTSCATGPPFMEAQTGLYQN